MPTGRADGLFMICMSRTEKKRLDYIDLCKGIAILLITSLCSLYLFVPLFRLVMVCLAGFLVYLIQKRRISGAALHFDLCSC